MNWIRYACSLNAALVSDLQSRVAALKSSVEIKLVVDSYPSW